MIEVNLWTRIRNARQTKAFAARRMRINNKRGHTKAPLWLKELDVEAKAFVSQSVDENGFSKMLLADFIKSKRGYLTPKQIDIAKERYAPFFAPNS